MEKKKKLTLTQISSLICVGFSVVIRRNLLQEPQGTWQMHHLCYLLVSVLPLTMADADCSGRNGVRLMLREIQSPSVRQDRCFHSEGYLPLSREEHQPTVLLISGPSPVCLHVPSHVLWWLMSVHFCNFAYRKMFLCIYGKTDLCVAPRSICEAVLLWYSSTSAWHNYSRFVWADVQWQWRPLGWKESPSLAI